MNFEIEFFETDNGDCPVISFLDELNVKLRAKTLRMIELLKENGNLLGMPYSRHLDDGIFELRTKQGSDITRVLYFFFVGQKIVMTNGFIKKTEKTPKSEIEIAKKYRDMYLERNEGDWYGKVWRLFEWTDGKWWV